MYENNLDILKEKIGQHRFIRPLKEHIRDDGSFDPQGYVEMWDEEARDFEKIMLWEDKPAVTGADAAYLIFLPSGVKNADTILVAHGGGFEIRTGCEGPNVAYEFHKRGYNTAILVYRLRPHSRYDSFKDYQQAVRILRGKREELEIGENIIGMGFSAGAMLTGNAAVYGEGDSRIDLAVISYGAMSCVSFPSPFMANVDDSLFGETPEDQFYFATEKHIEPSRTCPMFIWQTLSDDGRHGMVLARALQDAHVPYELHIFDGGVHGLGLADGENDLLENVPHINHWVTLCDEWIRMMTNKVL